MTSDPTVDSAALDWAPRIGGDLRTRALEAAALIAERVTQPERVSASVRLAHQQTHFPMSIHWDPTTVAQGDAGQALLASQLDRVFPHAGWDRVAHDHLARAVRVYRHSPQRSAGVISGLGGIAFTARRLNDDRRYNGLLTELNSAIAEAGLADAARIRGRFGVTVSSFDLISGLSGMVLALLPDISARPRSAALPFLIRGLSELALGERELPAWHTPADLLYDDDQRRQYPEGNLNCGLAHGVPGIVAALSLAALTGHGTDRADLAVRCLGRWLVEHSDNDARGPRWPTVVPLRRSGGMLVAVEGCDQSRDAWCYGTPGVARALYLAGQAVEEPAWMDLAVAAMEAVYARPVADRAIDSPTFCHGVAGLLQITLRFANDTGLPIFEKAAADLSDQILDAIDPERPMGIANLEPGDNPVDQPGLLDGATGVCLVLLAAATDVPPTWDRIFGLA